MFPLKETLFYLAFLVTRKSWEWVYGFHTGDNLNVVQITLSKEVTVSLQGPAAAAAQRRRLQQELNDPVLVAFGPVPTVSKEIPSNKINGRFTALAGSEASLPRNVHIVTVQVLEDGQLLLRLAHLFQASTQSEHLCRTLCELVGCLARVCTTACESLEFICMRLLHCLHSLTFFILRGDGRRQDMQKALEELAQ